MMMLILLSSLVLVSLTEAKMDVGRLHPVDPKDERAPESA